MESRPTAAIPIFVISFNRGDYAASVIESYRKQDVPVDIIVHDNGSSDPRTLQILSKLSSAGVSVYRYDAIARPDDLNDVNLSVERYRRETGYAGPYVVTDCDVDLTQTHVSAVRTYLKLLDMFGDVECVGPMLTIADIPKSYPLFNRVMTRHIAQFWGRQPEWVDLRGETVAYLKHRIDTTFAVHRSGSAFRRLKEGLRVYHPFEARHLDWYVSGDGPSQYRKTSSPSISHWDNESEFVRHGQHPDVDLGYNVVEGKLGELRCVVRSTLDNPD